MKYCGGGGWLPSLLLLLLGSTALTSITLVSANHENLKVDREFRAGFETKNAVGVTKPTDMYFTPDDKYLFVTSKDGRVWRINVDDMDRGKAEPELVFEIPHPMCTNGARGLGGIAIHPDYPRTKWIYVFHNHDKYDDCSTDLDLDVGPVNRFSRWTLNDDLDGVVKDSEKVMFETRRLNTQTHNSGDIAFGKDGYVYVTVGEAGTKKDKNKDGIYYPMANDVMLGVVVRLTDEGDIPDTNPYTPAMGDTKSVRCNEKGESGNPSKRCQEIYATGLRNPFRFAMDPNTDKTRFFVNEVGSNTWERVLEGGDGYAGANYGYPLREGPCEKSTDKNCKPNDDGYDEPVHWYHHNEEDGGAITGGAFVPNDAGWPSIFNGAYLYAEFAIGGIYYVKKDEGSGCPYPKCDPPVSDYSPSLKVFSEQKKVVGLQFGPYKGGKALYYLTHFPGGGGGKEAVYRIAYTDDSNRDPKATIVADKSVGFSPMTVNFDASLSVDPDDDDNDNLTYEWDFDGDGTVDSTKEEPNFVYTKAGIYEATLTVKDGRGGSDKTSLRIDVDNTPPQPVITSPAPGTTFAVGDKFVLKGYATDAEDGTLSDTSLTWEVRQHHNNHYHPFLDATTGNNIAIDPAPEPEDFFGKTTTTSYLSIYLTATDSNGLSSTVEYELKPRLVTVNFDSVPSGMTLLLNTDKFVTPHSLLTWENHRFEIEAPPQRKDDRNYVLKSWSDTGNKKTHDYLVGPKSETDSEPPTVVATFQPDRPMPPIPKIEGVSKSTMFTVGEEFTLRGSADQADSHLVWQVGMYYGNNRYEALLEPTEGNVVQVPAIPEPKTFDDAEVGYMEILLTATNDEGLSDATSIHVEPKKVHLEFDTQPSGLDLVLDGDTYTTPVAITTWEGDSFNVKTNSQTMDGAQYSFAEWSDGGRRSHKVTASSSDSTIFIADFDEQALPVPRIDSGFPSRFAVGDKLSFKGSARDGQGKNIAAKALTWQARLCNDDQDEDKCRTIVKSKKGRNFEVQAPYPVTFDEAAATSYLEILLSAVDSTGLSSTNSVIIEPKKVDLLLESDPSGYYVFADGFQFRTPSTVTAWENQRFIISTPTQRKSSVVYTWYWWSDGGEASHEYVVPRAKKNGKPHKVMAYLKEPEPTEASNQDSIFMGVFIGAGVLLLLVVFVMIIILRRKHRKGITIYDVNDEDDDFDVKKIDTECKITDVHSGTDRDGSEGGSHDDLEGVSECSVFALSQVNCSLASVSLGEVSNQSQPTPVAHQSSLDSIGEKSSDLSFPTPISLSKYLLNSSSSGPKEGESNESQARTKETMDVTAESMDVTAESNDDESQDTEGAGMYKDFALPDGDKELTDVSIDGMSLASSTRSEF